MAKNVSVLFIQSSFAITFFIFHLINRGDSIRIDLYFFHAFSSVRTFVSERSDLTSKSSYITIPTTETTAQGTVPADMTSTKTSTTTRTILTTAPSINISEPIFTGTSKLAAPVNVCDLPRDELQRLNISCEFNTEYGCAASYISPLDNYWKYQTKSVGKQLECTIPGDHSTGS
ncbi:hypothetical protein CHS0354_037930 [Potamilus streckersoni]|uniref:Uncharacterized protein n=1 Tax=Potamilus streckersoni TaxID=2493646 RepID=A0AAE0W8R0_9BIVA|nr:hypothetical protein CHS0354_037930 [Potamilus streckersoni]